MSNGIGRRDTLKLASAAAALGAGLGVVLKAQDALAGDEGVKTAPVPGGIVQDKQLPVNGLQQIKIDGYQKLRAEKGQLQIKLSTSGGQLLYAAPVPDEIGQLLVNAPGGQLQFKLYRPAVQGATLVPEAFKEGLMQFAPTTPAAVVAPKPALRAPVPTKQ